MITKYFRHAFVLFAIFATVISVSAQQETAEQTKARAKTLFQQQKLTEALPLYEQLSKQRPNDAEVWVDLGFCLLAQALATEGEAERKGLRVRARKAFLTSVDLGNDSLAIRGMIDGLPEDGSGTANYSDNAVANALMKKAEGYFTTGKLDDALKTYGEALAIDPRCYYAALFSGDVYFKTERYEDAEKWYQKAIAIDPFIETAHRYSASPLMRQKKYDQAKDRYIEAYILAPYNRSAISGIVQWANATGTQLGHPKIDVPKTTVDENGKENTTINLNPLTEDGSMAWIAYSGTRESWKKEKFRKAFPSEANYRHSLAEEADALRSVVEMAKTLKPKSLNEQIKMIERLDKDGVLEAFILMALPTEGIVRDHYKFVRTQREKLRKYVTTYVIMKK